MRLATAAACVVVIVLAAVLIVRLATGGPQIVVHAQINQDGSVVPAGDGTPADPAGHGTAVCPPLSIAMAGALTGPDADTGINIKGGVQLAIDRHNTANPGCQVQIKEFDTGGDPQRVSEYAPQIVADAYTVGLIGPTFSGVAEATGALFEENGLPAATASASRSSLSEQGWRTFFRAVSSDDAQGRAVANYLKNTLGYGKLCVVTDGTPYGDAVALAAGGAVGGRAAAECRSSSPLHDKEFGRVVEKIRAASPDAILRTGAYAGAGEFVRGLRDAGITLPVISAQGTADEHFVREAGKAGTNVLLSCPCGPDPEWFATQYRAKFGVAPGAYSAEGYDLATIMLNGIDGGKLVRSQMLDWMRHYNGQGVARRYQWTETGELTDPTVWIYKVQ